MTIDKNKISLHIFPHIYVLHFIDTSFLMIFGPTLFLCSVLVHSGGVHGGHYYAYIRPTLSDQWCELYCISHLFVSLCRFPSQFWFNLISVYIGAVILLFGYHL